MMLRDWNSEFRGSRVSGKEDKLNIALLGQQYKHPAQKPLPDLAPGSCLSPQLSVSFGSEGPCFSAAVPWQRVWPPLLPSQHHLALALPFTSALHLGLLGPFLAALPSPCFLRHTHSSLVLRPACSYGMVCKWECLMGVPRFTVPFTVGLLFSLLSLSVWQLNFSVAFYL